MQQQKINPVLLRMLVIVPNAMNYLLAVGIGIFLVTNREDMKAQGNLMFWGIAFLIIIGAALFTSISIIKRIRSGAM